MILARLCRRMSNSCRVDKVECWKDDLAADFSSAVTLAAATRMAKMPALDQLLLLIEQNCWQDVALSAGNIFFCFTLIPMLRHPGRPPLLTCIPTALALLAGGFVFATLHLWVTALTQAITGLQWLVLAFKEISLERRTSSGGECGCDIGMIASAR